MINGVIVANKHTHIVDCNFSAPVSRTHEKTFSFQKGQMLFCNKTLILKHTAQRYTPTI